MGGEELQPDDPRERSPIAKHSRSDVEQYTLFSLDVGYIFHVEESGVIHRPSLAD